MIMTPPDGFSALIASLLLDPFRIGLMAALLFTTIRNAAVTGWLVPFGAGMVFVAFVIATAFPAPGQSTAVATVWGIAANAILAALMFGALAAWRRFGK
jgi:hypothetical protein